MYDEKRLLTDDCVFGMAVFFAILPNSIACSSKIEGIRDLY